MAIPTITKIREFLANHSSEKLFTTRDLLNFGKRAAVDNATHQLVKNKEIRRIARGVFCSTLRRKRVTIMEVAETKAESFGRKLITHAENLAQKLGLIAEAHTENNCFATNGNSSSFRFSGLIIHFKRISTRKFNLGESKSGQLIRALTHLGKAVLDSAALDHLLQNASRSQLNETLKFSSFMPAWLSDFFKDYLEDRARLCQAKETVKEASPEYVLRIRSERSFSRQIICYPKLNHRPYAQHRAVLRI